MPHTEKDKKNIKPTEEIPKFSWGGRTQEWEEESEQLMHYMQDQIDNQERDEELNKKIEYAKQKQYW
ncbi:hypothetical protein [Serpentinicella alkaliphila]|uniref:Uncharacterized protein n=1 Tax=Serpentinicella alkaliphila TaxID=1734049 RepID=A0A4V2T586_9FIRM|nr:hypothetical protein [Serpentinicella alkaliphila]QUH26838.1 hypothetical protein HZR23_14640 [Serpentinicella alkaliphila]TCQ08064.1 hypothetical protein EDD79_1001151 [Serpentinicella alkaliphila]